jgi:hypothetical protein
VSKFEKNATARRLLGLATMEFERNPDNTLKEEMREIPFRPEFLQFINITNGKDPEPWVWRQETDPLKDPTVEPDGALEGPEPRPIHGYEFIVDLRACTRFGFNMTLVRRVELPVLDYASSAPLMMRVYLLIPKKE